MNWSELEGLLSIKERYKALVFELTGCHRKRNVGYDDDDDDDAMLILKEAEKEFELRFSSQIRKQ